MRKATLFIIAASAVIGGYFLGKASREVGPGGGGTSDRSGLVAGASVRGADGVERKHVPLEGHARGAKDALVNIVVFSDFQCPFCSRVNPTLEQLLKTYPGKIQVFFRHYPLPFHQEAPLASQAALAAGAQGKFWEMHDKLFENQQALKRADLEKYAQELGLDVGKIKTALDAGTYKKQVDDDMALGQKVGVSGTPNIFINGRNLVGAQPYESFKQIVDQELATADKLMKQGTRRDRVYAEMMKGAANAAAPAAAAPSAPAAPRAPNVSAEVYKVVVGQAATKGAKQPKVTIVEYSDFECPFCSRVNPSIDALLKEHGNDVQVAFKHFPLDFHKNAMPAAEAAEEAKAQGKFWQMHDKLFANQQALTRADLDKYAQEIGLDMGKFKAAMDSGKHKAAIDADKNEAAKFGVGGTPTSFINGRLFRGAQPLESWKAVVAEELKKADAKLAAGVSRGKLYEELTKEGLDKAAAPPAPAPTAARAGEPQAGEVYKAEVAGAPSKGPKDALVTIVQFSDFQCPFCTRVEPTMDEVMKTYAGKVRIVWRDLPLPFHPHATPAAIAARAAGQQGKFWEMHKKLFENQQALEPANLEKYAQELGLNMGKFKAAMADEKLKKAVEADAAMAARLGANGTPAFFINGTFLSGAQPFGAFQARIDQELKKAEELVKKGTPKAKVYDAIMKTAKAEVAKAAAAAPAAGEEPSPENDETVHKVEVGSAPSRGPKNAPVTMVLFSDFQCPFCTRVKTTIDQIEKEYAGKVRLAFKHYPLPFHQDARPAAEAAMAAHEQGKFWEMHDKLFENQRALGRPELDKYAQELGLNMTKFKAAMDSKKYAAVVDSDMKEGQTLGVQGTPATFINGRRIPGAYPYEVFKKMVDQELAKGAGGKAKRKLAAAAR